MMISTFAVFAGGHRALWLQAAGRPGGLLSRRTAHRGGGRISSRDFNGVGSVGQRGACMMSAILHAPSCCAIQLLRRDRFQIRAKRSGSKLQPFLQG
ncbi:hypothetical protein ASPSYDRAFT_42313 [Aspergillus sydowii CBS 593.65]|uniref:Uncharacterized protein n=1 Tax=Aspergillus sydowii CBS 593.65 TaxID=1036612 RepID=A0A1L9TMN2_9EURO|nr:uncharacterized protein ASPSYDRAFT_42313 [Aspergillus sydowii CBS 593.65]OJJ60553.1 hypothetical protein ASPSYDRAFT_42313 [Aspergillus sydowii CBS 593.65]